MKAAVYEAPQQIVVQDLGEVTVGDDDVLLTVEACGVCGSDVASYQHGHYANPGQVLGHEMSAIVSVIGRNLADSGEIAIGDRVAVRPSRSCQTCHYCIAGRPQLCGESGLRTLGYGARGGFAETVLMTDATVGADVIPVPATTSADDLVWAEPLAVAVHAVLQAAISPTSSILVLGGGSIGICVVAAALAVGVASVTVSEPRLERRATAIALGATALDDADSTGTNSFDVVIDTSGSAAAITAALTRLAPGGRIVLVGLGDAHVPWPVGPVDIIPSFAYSDDDFRTAVDHIVSGRVLLGRFITHRFGLADTGAAIARSGQDPSVVKAIVEPGR
jgi:2-desacetyl-2-hydroxyethyl bacteriochlorophyllide A dehydrogenase